MASNKMKGHDKGLAKSAIAAVVVGIILIAVYNSGMLGGGRVVSPFAAAPGAAPATITIQTPTVAAESIPIGSINANVQDCLAGSYITAGVSVFVYDATVDPSSPTATNILSFTPGTADTTTKLYTERDYKILFTDDSTSNGAYSYYDKSYFGLDSNGKPKAGKLTAPRALSAATATAVLDFTGSNCVYQNATANDIVDESTSANFGVTSSGAECSNASVGDATCSFIVGTSDPIGNGDTVYYDRSIGSGTASVRLTFGAAGGNKAEYRAGLCFNDADADMNGTEFTSVLIERISGKQFDIRDENNAAVGGELVNIWKNNQCIKLLDDDSTPEWIEGGESGIYKITFTVQEGSFDTSKEFTMERNDLAWKTDTGAMQMNGKDLRNNPGTDKVVLTISTQA